MPSITRSEVGSAVELDARLGGVVADRQRRLPRVDSDHEVMPGLCGGAGSPGPHREGAVIGPELMST